MSFTSRPLRLQGKGHKYWRIWMLLVLRLSLSEDKVKREVQVRDFKLQQKEFF